MAMVTLRGAVDGCTVAGAALVRRAGPRVSALRVFALVALVDVDARLLGFLSVVCFAAVRDVVLGFLLAGLLLDLLVGLLRRGARFFLLPASSSAAASSPCFAEARVFASAMDHFLNWCTNLAY
jgi:hypothetical protein